MKKLLKIVGSYLVVLMSICVLVGCARMKQCDMIGKPTAYASEKHLWYSWFGYKHTDIEDVVTAYNEKWWGCPVYYYVPGEGPKGQGK